MTHPTTPIDLDALERLALAATPGPWWIDSHGKQMVSHRPEFASVFITDDSMGPAVRHPETGNISHWRNDHDASYIAAANPQTILELIRLARSAPSAGEVADIHSCSHLCMRPLCVAQRRVDELVTECQELREDAARYRAIRNAPYSDRHGDLYAMTFQGDGDLPVHGADLDVMADAAIAAQGGAESDAKS